MRKINLFACFLIAVLFSGAGFLLPQPAVAESIPEEAYIHGLVGHGQQYPLSCESRSASDLAAFWGLAVSETNFLNSLGISDNPNVGFVNSVYGKWGQIPPNPYGVHAIPVARQLRYFGLDAQAQKNMSWDDLRAEVAAGRPAIVWVIGLVWTGTQVTYHALDGEVLPVAAYEHSMIMIGYDRSNVYLVNSSNGLTNTYPINSFLTSWSVLDNMAVTATGTTNPLPKEDGETYIVQRGDYLSKLGKLWEVEWLEVASINNLHSPYIIYPGQKLIVPKVGLTSEVLMTNSTPTTTPAQSPNLVPTPTEEPVILLSAVSADPSSPAEPTHIVKQGEHLMKIARLLSLDWLEIAEINDLHPPYVLYPGQVLNLPVSARETSPDIHSAEDTNTISGKASNTYKVQHGDYLVALARRLGINWRDLAAINDISYPWIIQPDQVLLLP